MVCGRATRRPRRPERLTITLPKPTHCPGCRALLPAPGRERGLVKWYNRRKRFGFIARRNQPDLFVHGSQLDGPAFLSPDELVEFSVIETDKGLAASAVRVSGGTGEEGPAQVE